MRIVIVRQGGKIIARETIAALRKRGDGSRGA